MFNTINIKITLPNPVKDKCGGFLVPILQPTEFTEPGSGMKYAKLGFNEVIWKCSKCGKIIKG